MSVIQVRGRIQLGRSQDAGQKALTEASERIIALEKAVRAIQGGSVDTFTSPETPAFGAGSGSGSTTVVNSTTTTNVTNVNEETSWQRAFLGMGA